MALTVLIADDEPDMRLYLRSCLRGLGPRIGRILEAADGADALSVVRSESVDVVICDILMPHAGGCDLWRAVRDEPRLRHLPVLLISGEERSSSGAANDGFLKKPFNAAQLEAALFELIPRFDPAAP